MFYHFKVTWFLCQAGVEIRNKYLVVTYTYYARNFSASIQGPSGVMVSSVNRTEITVRWTEANSICSGSISSVSLQRIVAVSHVATSPGLRPPALTYRYPVCVPSVFAVKLVDKVKHCTT